MPNALVIGIDRYAAKRIPALKCAVNDAEVMSRRLVDAGFEVVTLTDDAATRKDISWQLEVGLNDRVPDEDDPVLIYWAGHGMSDLRENADSDEGWSTFLLPFDADIDQPLASAFPVQNVWALLNRLRTRRLLVMLDTCFSGAFAEDDRRGFSLGGRGGSARMTDDFLRMEGHGRVVISACGPNEVARENSRNGHGNFTRSVLSVMERGVDLRNRQVKITTLMADIREEVQRETRGAQTPFLHVASRGADWSVPLPPRAPYQSPVPSWAFVGTSGGVGKTTLAMMTAELLAESGNTVLYLDADIAHHGGTSEWCQRAKIDLGATRTFADHVAMFSRAKTSTRVGQLNDRLLDVTPDYLRRHGCGTIHLLPAARAGDRLFAFDLVAEIKDRRSNETCRRILDAALDRGVRQGATCVVIDCGAQFDPLAVNALTAAHHPFIVAASRAGARDQRETILSNCAQTVDEFNRMRVETVVNRAPSREALVQHWGEPGYGRGNYYHWLPFDRALFQDWEEGRPNFELGYDELSHSWHEILVASDRNSCDGLHRNLLPSEWDRFSKWALWIINNPGWAETERNALSRMLRRSYLLIAGYFVGLGVSLTSMLLHIFAEDPAKDHSFLPQWLAITLVALIGFVLLSNIVGGILLRRRRKVLREVIKYSVSTEELKRWFSIPRSEGAWWKVWKASRRAAIEWLHKRVVAAREAQLPSGEIREART
ncbi:caspase family protein [Amycolatopsis sp. NPDC059027]|uniref:caspase family protein n=1 Tax=unclassified Amycolatopsis TaxID=2618356 RepID=UPI00366E8F73